MFLPWTHLPSLVSLPDRLPTLEGVWRAGPRQVRRTLRQDHHRLPHEALGLDAHLFFAIHHALPHCTHFQRSSGGRGHGRGSGCHLSLSLLTPPLQLFWRHVDVFLKHFSEARNAFLKTTVFDLLMELFRIRVHLVRPSPDDAMLSHG